MAVVIGGDCDSVIELSDRVNVLMNLQNSLIVGHDVIIIKM